MINKANNLNTISYSAKTWDIFANALEDAKAVLDDPEASEEEVAIVYESLKAGIAGLEVISAGDTTVSVAIGDTTNLIYSLAGLAIATVALYENKKRKRI